METNKIIKKPRGEFTRDCHSYIMRRMGFEPDPAKEDEETRKIAIYIATVFILFVNYSIDCVLRRILEIDYIWRVFEDQKWHPREGETYLDLTLIYISSRLTDPEIGNDHERYWIPTNDWKEHTIEEKKIWVKEALSLLANSNAKETVKKIIEIDNLLEEFDTKFGERYK